MKKAAVVGLLLVVAGMSFAEETRFAPTIREVSLFKNGLGYFNLQGTLPAGTDALGVGDIPRSVHGTYWFHYDPRSVTLSSLVTGMRKEEYSEPVSTLAEILEANVGNEIEIRTGNETRKVKVLKVLKGESIYEPQPLYSMSARIIPYQAPSLVLIQTGTMQEILPIGNIQSVTSAGAFTLSRTGSREKAEMRVHYSAVSPAQCFVSYLARGLTWAPSYVIDLSKEGRAIVRLKAEVINDAADLEKVSMNFISGFPNIAFSNVTSPISGAESLDAFLASLSGGGRSGAPRREYMITQQAMLNAAYYDGGGAVADDAGTGEYEGDLFYYTINDVTLKKGERGLFPVVERDVECEHVYTWEVAESRGGVLQNSSQSAENKTEDVWHAVKLKNSSAQPWTTAPALSISNGRLLGQDIMYYTAPGASTRVRISKAMEIAARSEEYEKERKRNAVTIRSTTYDQVLVEGVLSIRNSKNEAVAVEITKSFEGELEKADRNPKEERTVEGLRRANPNTRLKWELTLEPKSEIEIRYEYRVLVP